MVRTRIRRFRLAPRRFGSRRSRTGEGASDAPLGISSYPGGGYLLDFGVNMTGWVRIKLPEMEKGDTLRIDYAEKLGNDGLLDKSNLRDAYARDIYIADSISGGEWRRLGDGGAGGSRERTGEWVYDKMAQIGSFTTDDERFNRVLENAANSIRGTYKGVPLDCPQRSKRLPWLGDRVMESRGETYLFDNNSVYEHWLAKLRGRERPSHEGQLSCDEKMARPYSRLLYGGRADSSGSVRRLGSSP